MIQWGAVVILVGMTTPPAVSEEGPNWPAPLPPMQLVQQRAAREAKERKARLAAKKQVVHRDPSLVYPGGGISASRPRTPIDYGYSRRNAQRGQ
jgi:hypothetical protein